MEPIVTFRERCRRCYSCVRSCPVKAIKVDQGFARIMYERCIGCGNCLACPQQAKAVVDRMLMTQELLASDFPVVAVLGCSFPAYFSEVTPGQLVSALKSIGFCEVHEGAFGARMISEAYRQAVRLSAAPLVFSHCPAVVDLVERHYPKLVPNLAPIVSPMIAMGRFIKAVRGREVKVVYLSTCVAAKFEMNAPESSGAVDVVLTYDELDKLLKRRGINPSSLSESPFEGVDPGHGRMFSLSGGPLKVFGMEPDFMDTDTISAEGESRSIGIIKDLAAGRISPGIVDLRFCDGGCVDGPSRFQDMHHFFKHRLIVSYNAGALPYKTVSAYEEMSSGVDFRRTFSGRSVKLPTPRNDDIKRILHSTGKFSRGDELNCNACGYNSCREHAVAVFQGLADIQMCLPNIIQKIEEDRGLIMEKYELVRRELDRQLGDDVIIGSDPEIEKVLELIRQVASTPTTVLIRGETGTGKELTARAIHRLSSRSDKPLVTVNCTTLADSLLESELFGHKKGAFTGAVSERKGLFEAADGGTIFLDEIGDITPKLQAELLRLLDQGEVRPVGSNTSKRVDVRLIAATNRNLEEGVRDGWFREDLFYRLNVFFITLPPLRERLVSIPALAQHFLSKSIKKLNKKIVGIEEKAIQAMQLYDWPGNIREMQNIIERSAVLAADGVIRLENLPTALKELGGLATKETSAGESRKATLRQEREAQLAKTEQELIRQYLEDSGGNVSKAARLADVPRRTFYRMLNRHGLLVEKKRNGRLHQKTT